MIPRKRALAMLLAAVMCVSLVRMGAPAMADEKPADANPPAISDANEAVPIWKDNSLNAQGQFNYSFEERAADLVNRLTLNEESSVMNSNESPAIPRLGIDYFHWWNEALHGVYYLTTSSNSSFSQSTTNATSYPLNLSRASTWDKGLEYKVGSEVGKEARELAAGNDKNLDFWSPVVNLLRDSRWGRADESYGEDPYLSGSMGACFSKGLEGKEENSTKTLDPKGYKQAISTMKHFLANNSEVNRCTGTSDMTDIELHEYYAKVYENLVKQADISSAMSSYNSLNIVKTSTDNAYKRMRDGTNLDSYSAVNDVPASLNNYTMNDVLRRTFGFSGYITGDCDSVFIAYGRNPLATPAYLANVLNKDLHEHNSRGHNWYLPKAYLPSSETDSRPINKYEAAAWALSAGEDMECNAGEVKGQDAQGNQVADDGPDANNPVGFDYGLLIPKAVSKNIKTPAGTFDKNTVDMGCWRLMTARYSLGEFDDKAYDGLNKTDKSTGLVKVYDDTKQRLKDTYGDANWTHTANDAKTETDSRLQLASDDGAASIVLLKNDAPTSTVKDGDTPDKAAKNPLLPLKKPDNGHLKVAIYGYYSNNSDFYLGSYSGSLNSLGRANCVSPYEGLKKYVQKIDSGATVDAYCGFVDSKGNPISFVSQGGFFGGTSASSLNNINEAETKKASDYDVVFVYLGTDSNTAAENIGDRLQLKIPGNQTGLINAVRDNNPNTVVMMETNAQNETAQFEKNVPAVLWSSYLSMRKGEAFGRVVTGDYNPSGHLPTIWIGDNSNENNIESYRLSPGEDGPYTVKKDSNGKPVDKDGKETTDQSQYTYNKSTGRTYMYYSGDNERWAFGHGLSYTKFQYSNPTIKKGVSDTGNAKYTVECDVKNIGSVDGNEVAQLYVATPNLSISEGYPYKRLVGFNKVFVKAGETQHVSFDVNVEDLAFWHDQEGTYQVTPTQYEFQIAEDAGIKGKYDDNANVVRVPLDLTGGAGVTEVPNVVTFKAKTTDCTAEQQLIYKVNDVINPNIEISSNLDKLYTDMAKKPGTWSIKYTSNRPNVAQVQDNGTVKAMNPGVATVTATVTAGGVTKTGHFVVYVRGTTKLANLKASCGDTNYLTDFNPYTYDYTVTVPYASNQETCIEYTPEGDGETVTFSGDVDKQDISKKQATSIATLERDKKVVMTVSDANGNKEEYTVTVRMSGVSPDKLKAAYIRVNGEDLALDNDTITVAADKTKTAADYVVTAQSYDPLNTCTIVQPKSIPGTATVTINSVGGSRTYTIKFLTEGKSVSFLPSDSINYVTIDKGAATNVTGVAEGKGIKLLTSTTPDVVRISANDPQSGDGKWTSVTKIDLCGGKKLGYFNFGGGMGENVLVYVANDEKNYVGMNLTNNGITPLYYANGNPVTTSTFKPAIFSGGMPDSVYLRVDKSGKDYHFYYGENPDNAASITWNDLGNVDGSSISGATELRVKAASNTTWFANTPVYLEYAYFGDYQDGDGALSYGVQNAADYIAGFIGNKIAFSAGSNKVILPNFSGKGDLGTYKYYDVNYVCDNTQAVSADGTVTAPKNDQKVKLEIDTGHAGKTGKATIDALEIPSQAFSILSVKWNKAALSLVSGDLKASVAVQNTRGTPQKAIMIVALYKDEIVNGETLSRFVTYASAGKEIAPNTTENLEGGFKCPFAEGQYQGYTAKVMVWDGDSWESTTGQPLCDPVLMPQTAK